MKGTGETLRNFFLWQATPTTVHNSNIITPVASAAIEKLQLIQRETGDRDRDPAPELRVATDSQEGDRQRHIARLSRSALVQGNYSSGKQNQERDVYLNRYTCRGHRGPQDATHAEVNRALW